jgi:RNA polymerase sigma factor (sigma-70 family)
MGDLELLREYTDRNSEAAFTTLVDRHASLVFSAALRQVRDRQLAEEVTQAVFIVLARKALAIRRGTSLAGWLYRTTRFAASDALKSQYRRQQREQEAAHMQTDVTDDPNWEEVAPLMDEAMAKLREKDRTAVLLRFFENRSLAEVGAKLGATPGSARMRVARAIEKLRLFLTRRGIVLSAASVAGLLSANAVQAAPAGLANSAATLALLKGTTATVPIIALVKGTLKLMTWLKIKTAAYAGTAGLLAVGGMAVAINEIQNKPPDPLDLLKSVARARQKIASGEMELEATFYDFGRPLDGTNQWRLNVVFDGEKRRFDSVCREYAYVFMGPEADKVTDAKRLEFGLDREAAVRAGLFTGFESHHVAAYDGAILLDYWATEESPASTTIHDPAKQDTATWMFDPRVLGLASVFSWTGTIENYAGTRDAKSVNLVGKASVEGIAAWRVRLQHQYDWTMDFWIDAAHPDRVIMIKEQSVNGRTVLISHFDPAHPNDPIPTEVTLLDFRRKRNFPASWYAGIPKLTLLDDFYRMKKPDWERHFKRRSARYNIPVDPASWTLAGLGMPIGTDVNDNRTFRRLGYWNGTGLSEFPPPGTPAPPKPRILPSPDNLLALVEKDLKSPFALEAATSIILNAPDGPEVERAAEIILREHTSSSNLFYLCQGLLHVRHRCAKTLLQSVLEKNPHAKVQAHACFALATHLKHQSNDSGDEQAAKDAERLFERVIDDFGDLESDGTSLAGRAGPELSELRRLGIGKVAPETDGEDLDGGEMKLSDYRGKVVVLTFWGTWCGPCMALVPEERNLLERLTGKPFALIGVNSDNSLAKVKAASRKERITWPSFRDGGTQGPIATLWKVHSWPTVYVLDREGVIRYRDLRGQALADAVDTLIRERSRSPAR